MKEQKGKPEQEQPRTGKRRDGAAEVSTVKDRLYAIRPIGKGQGLVATSEILKFFV